MPQQLNGTPLICCRLQKNSVSGFSSNVTCCILADEKGQQKRVCECCVEPCSLFTPPSMFPPVQEGQQQWPPPALQSTFSLAVGWRNLSLVCAGDICSHGDPGLFLLSFPSSWMWTCVFVDFIVCGGVMSERNSDKSTCIHTCCCCCQVKVTVWLGWFYDARYWQFHSHLKGKYMNSMWIDQMHACWQECWQATFACPHCGQQHWFVAAFWWL